MVVPIASLGRGFPGATESVSTHLPASRFQMVVVPSAVSPSLGVYVFQIPIYCDFHAGFGETANLDMVYHLPS